MAGMLEITGIFLFLGGRGGVGGSPIDQVFFLGTELMLGPSLSYGMFRVSPRASDGVPVRVPVHIDAYLLLNHNEEDVHTKGQTETIGRELAAYIEATVRFWPASTTLPSP